MRVAVLNPMFGKDFTKSARWFARSRGRVQRHPDYLATAVAVLEQAGHELLFLDSQAKNMPTPEVIEKHLKAFKPDMTVYQATTPSIYADIESARLCKEAVGGLHVMVGPHVSAEAESTLRAANPGRLQEEQGKVCSRSTSDGNCVRHLHGRTRAEGHQR